MEGGWHPSTKSISKRLPLLRSELAFIETWTEPGDPGVPEIRVEAEMEVPIKRERYKSFDIIGYADLVLSIQTTSLFFYGFPTGAYGQPQLGIDLSKIVQWQKGWGESRTVAFDAKSCIPSLGELIRQLKTYRTFCSWPFFIVS